jgi:SsrA-binding protein
MNIVNKKIGNYFIQDEFEAGIMLSGAEIKCIRSRGMDINQSFVHIDAAGEAWLVNANIPVMSTVVGIEHFDPIRTRKLLLNKKEIFKIKGMITEKGYTVVPKKCYMKGQRLKVQIAVVKGKKEYDKRQDIKERESNREIERVMKKNQKTNY